MSTTKAEKDDLVFIFLGHRGLSIGSIFFRLIKEDFVGKRYDILDFFSKVYFICETEKEYREIGGLIEGYIPEENVLLMGKLTTDGDLWSNIEGNEEIFANRIFAPLMFAVDQLERPNLLLFYDLSNGKQAGICDYLLKNFPIVKSSMPIYIVATTSIDEGAGALSIYWSILGLNSIASGITAKACILLDYEAIGNSIYLHRIQKFSDVEFETYNYVVAKLIYFLTSYDREPYANFVPFCQLVEKLVIFEDMKYVIPFVTMPRRELIEDELFSGYLNELVNDCNLFTIRYKKKNEDITEEQIPKMGIANAFIAFGMKQDTHYLNLIRNNLPPIVEYLNGKAEFYTYPRGEEASVFLENNTVVRQYFQDLLQKFDILISHHSYLHILEELDITRESFAAALDKLVSLVDAYDQSEELLYDNEGFDYEKEIAERYGNQANDEDFMKEYEENETEGIVNEEGKEENETINDGDHEEVNDKERLDEDLAEKDNNTLSPESAEEQEETIQNPFNDEALMSQLNEATLRSSNSIITAQSEHSLNQPLSASARSKNRPSKSNQASIIQNTMDREAELTSRTRLGFTISNDPTNESEEVDSEEIQLIPRNKPSKTSDVKDESSLSVLMKINEEPIPKASRKSQMGSEANRTTKISSPQANPMDSPKKLSKEEFLSRIRTRKDQKSTIIARSTQDIDMDEDSGALAWLQIQAQKKLEKVEKEREEIERKQKEIEEAEEKRRIEEEALRVEEEKKMKRKKEDLADIARMFENI